MTPPRVLIDTNVLVSAVLFGGAPGRVVALARADRIQGVVSLHILSEFREVLMRDRFRVDIHLAEALAEEIATFCEVSPVERASAAWTLDPDDDPVVEAALGTGAQYVVTGDRHLLGLSLPGIDILTPAQFLERNAV